MEGPFDAMTSLFRGAHDHVELAFVVGLRCTRLFVSEATPVPSLREYRGCDVSPAEWFTYALDVDQEVAAALFAHVETVYAPGCGLRYDSVGARLCVAPAFMRSERWCRFLFGRSPAKNGTFCSKMACSALRTVGLCADIDPDASSAQDVVTSLRRVLSRVSSVTPVRSARVRESV